MVLVTMSFLPFAQTVNAIPVTEGASDNPSAIQTASILPMAEFANAVKDGEDLVRGIYVEDVMALRVVQQPAGNAGFVSAITGVATQFKLAEKYGTVGLLAHNYAAGSLFSNIVLGDVINTIHGTGDIEQYKVTSIVSFQALSPNSPTSSFIDLDTGDKLSAGKLFEKIYKGEPHLVLQTCIARDNEDSWGRMFIVAEPITDL